MTKEKRQKLLALFFMPQILIWPKEKHPGFYIKTNDGWKFNNRLLFRKFFTHPAPWLCFVVSVVATGIYCLVQNETIDRLCLEEHHRTNGETYWTAEFENGLGAISKYKLENTSLKKDWISKGYTYPTGSERNKIEAAVISGHKWHENKCFEF